MSSVVTALNLKAFIKAKLNGFQLKETRFPLLLIFKWTLCFLYVLIFMMKKFQWQSVFLYIFLILCICYKIIKLIKKNICLNVIRESRFKMIFVPFQSFSIIYFHRKLYYLQLPLRLALMSIQKLCSLWVLRWRGVLSTWFASVDVFWNFFPVTVICLSIVFLYDKRAT